MNRINLTYIIDDDPIFIFAAKRVLKSSNLCDNFAVYNNGLEALNSIKPCVSSDDELPDVIFLDINMPIMDGWQFLDEFIKLKFNKLITVYIVSSSVDPADIKKSKSYSVIDDFLVKPLKKTTLHKAVKQVVEKQP